MPSVAYTPSPSIRTIKSKVFDAWLSTLRDRQARIRIAARLDRLSVGNAGDVRPVGSSVSEMRIDHGPGYRVYFKQQGAVIVLILCGGDKRTQAADIRRAVEMARNWES